MRSMWPKTCMTLLALFATTGVVLAQETPPAERPTPLVPPADPNQQPGPTGTPKLELSQTVWDFGTVWYGEPASQVVTLKNTGDGVLEILEVKTSCGCTVAKPETNSLKPGETTTMTVSYNTKKRKGKATQTVTIRTNDPALPTASLQVQGEIKAAYEVEPTAGLEFGRLSRNSVETRSVIIRNMFDKEMFLKLRPDKSEAGYEIQLKEVEPGKVYELTATTKPPLSNGVLKQDIVLETGVERLPEIPIRVNAFVPPRVAVSPARIYVPEALNRATERSVKVTYQVEESKPFEIVSVVCESDKVTSKVLPPPATDVKLTFATREIRLALPPSSDLPKSCKVEITTNAEEPEFKKFTIEIHKQPAQSRGALPGQSLAPPGTKLAPETPAAPPAPGDAPEKKDEPGE